MLKFQVFVCFILCIYSTNGKFQSIVMEESTVCTKDNYKIPLFSTENLRITFNQTRLRQLNVHTIHIRAEIDNQKVAEFENQGDTINKVFHLINTTSGKPKCPTLP